MPQTHVTASLIPEDSIFYILKPECSSRIEHSIQSHHIPGTGAVCPFCPASSCALKREGTPPSLPASLPHRPRILTAPQPHCLQMAFRAWAAWLEKDLASSCPSVSCIYPFGVSSSLSPRLLHLRPSEVHWDAPQRINDSTVGEVGEEKHFTARGKAGAITKKLESDRLGLAGGVLEGRWAAPGVTSPASRARRVTPSR